MPLHIKTFWKLSCTGAILFAYLTGCADGMHDFKIRFDNVYGLQKGAPVYFEESVIGNVEKVEYTDDGHFLVSVAIQPEFASAATAASRFYIDADPQKGAQKVIRVVQLEPGGQPIAEDAVVDGHTRYAVLYEQFARQLGQNIADLESGINAFLNELQGIPADEQIKEIERQLDAIIANLGGMSREMKDRLENEILPLIKEKIEDLRKRLEGSGREEALDPLDEKMDTIDDRLST
jgi:ABC-type transporter Mla subunit MlaD